MAQLTITVPDSVVGRVLAAMCTRFNYDGPDVQADKVDFVKAHLRNYVKQITKEYEVMVASDAAAVTASDAVETEIVIT